MVNLSHQLGQGRNTVIQGAKVTEGLQRVLRVHKDGLVELVVNGVVRASGVPINLADREDRIRYGLYLLKLYEQGLILIQEKFDFSSTSDEGKKGRELPESKMK